MQNEPKSNQLGDDFEYPVRGIQMFTTSQGSKYAYFDNGQTQRYKEFDKEYRAPQDILVFVPDFEWFSKNAPPELRGKFLDEKAYDVHMNLLAHDRSISVKIVDAKGVVLKKSEDLRKPGTVYLAFTTQDQDKKERVVFSVPVAKVPRLGFTTFDMRTEETADSVATHRHFGNKVSGITKGDPLPASSIMPSRNREPGQID